MRRIQLHIAEDLDEAVAAAAAREGVSKAALIRRFVAEGLGPVKNNRDPMEDIIGQFEGSDDDVDIDEVVYGR